MTAFPRTLHPQLIVLLCGCCAALAALWPLSPAQAHAAFGSSDPAPYSNLKAAPTTITITFVENVAPSGLQVVVYDNTGKVVSTGPAVINPKNSKQVSVAMQGDKSDIYRVDWQNVSADDNDPTLGAFVFGVNTDKASAPSTPKATDTGVSPLVAVLIGLAGLVVGAGGAYYYFSRVRPTA
jgi:methionine-rich copper-binding protein CopC